VAGNGRPAAREQTGRGEPRESKDSCLSFRPPSSRDSGNIGHHGDAHGANDVAGEVEDVLYVDQADVGLGEQAPGQAEAADLYGFKARAFDDPGAQCVVAAGHHQGLAALQGGPQDGCAIVHSGFFLGSYSMHNNFRRKMSEELGPAGRGPGPEGLGIGDACVRRVSKYYFRRSKMLFFCGLPISSSPETPAQAVCFQQALRREFLVHTTSPRGLVSR